LRGFPRLKLPAAQLAKLLSAKGVTFHDDGVRLRLDTRGHVREQGRLTESPSGNTNCASALPKRLGGRMWQEGHTWLRNYLRYFNGLKDNGPTKIFGARRLKRFAPLPKCCTS
jgi:hypothetical protein